MKYILAILGFFIVIAIFLIGTFHVFHPSPMSRSVVTENTTHTPSPVTTGLTTTLFVPYWTLQKALPTTYNAIAYFGITADSQGINTDEDGYKAIMRFARSAPASVKTLLVVRLLNPDVNDKVLTDMSLQQKIISESIQVAQQYGFRGIVVDFEYNALAFDTVVNHITTFAQNFSSQVHAQQLAYYQTLYGDTFYRARPFDVKAIGEVSDGIFVMAYDFHKANGNPGPNFPLHSLPDEDYNFVQMVNDFTTKVSPQKITILFGLFGYDWTMNNKNQSLGQATVLTTQEAQSKFLRSCPLKNCKIARDAFATEPHITYIDANGRVHEVWFEDMESVAKKEDFLKTKGIFSTGFWAWSYF